MGEDIHSHRLLEGPSTLCKGCWTFSHQSGCLLLFLLYLVTQLWLISLVDFMVFSRGDSDSDKTQTTSSQKTQTSVVHWHWRDVEQRRRLKQIYIFIVFERKWNKIGSFRCVQGDESCCHVTKECWRRVSTLLAQEQNKTYSQRMEQSRSAIEKPD